MILFFFLFLFCSLLLCVFILFALYITFTTFPNKKCICASKTELQASNQNKEWNKNEKETQISYVCTVPTQYTIPFCSFCWLFVLFCGSVDVIKLAHRMCIMEHRMKNRSKSCIYSKGVHAK